VHPHYREVIATYLSGVPCTIQEIPHVNGITDIDALRAAMKDDVAAVILQQPNVFGCLEPMQRAGELAHGAGALFVANAYPISLGVIEPPGSYGADIAVGEGRCFGTPVTYGGPGLGLFAAKDALLRKLPGRLAGCSVDAADRRGFTLTLQTREQHIRRENATSNICTNEGWICLRATIWLSLLGPQGLRDVAETSLRQSHRLAERLREIPWIQPIFEQPFFNEFAVRYTGGRTIDDVNKRLLKADIVGGLSLKPWYPSLGEAALWCATDVTSDQEIDRVVSALSERT